MLIKTKTIIVNGNELKDEILEKISTQIQKENLQPTLAVIFLGEDPATSLYVQHKIQAAKQVGIQTIIFHHKEIEEKEVIKQLEIFNNDPQVSGILIQLPLLKNINHLKLFNLINPLKDVDGFSPFNKGLMDNNLTKMIPATAKAVIKIIDKYNINLEGKEILLIGYSDLLGMPLAKYFLNKKATIKVVHDKSKDWISTLNQYDIVVSAVGKRNLFKATDIKKDAIVIGIGVSKDENDQIHGDFDDQEFEGIASLITPTPGGVGPITVACLLENTLIAHRKQLGLENKKGD